MYSICNWGLADPWLFAPTVGGVAWRTTGDISDSWGSVTSILDQQAGLELFSRKGFYNDPDMLEVGNGGMTQAEYTAHFSLWALLSSPLLLGNDLRSVSASTLSILANRDVLAVNQDWGGSQGRRVADFGETEVWAKPMSDGSAAVVLFNRTGAPTTVATTAAAVGVGGSSRYTVKDLWSKATSTSAGTISATVPAHGVVMYRVTRNGEQLTSDGGVQAVDGAFYPKGIGVHAAADLALGVSGCSRFTAVAGIDGETAGRGSAVFSLVADGTTVYTSPTVTPTSPVLVDVGIAGRATLRLVVADGGDGKDYDHADWADARLLC